jgi:branched-subunit amino acid transport protein AzlD
MSMTEQILTIAVCIAATMLTRFLPFLVFSSQKPTPAYIEYLGKVLPTSIFAMLIVYCLRHVNFLTGSHGLPELAGVLATVILHLAKRNMMLSMVGGTAVYMLLIR